MIDLNVSACVARHASYSPVTPTKTAKFPQKRTRQQRGSNA